MDTGKDELRKEIGQKSIWTARQSRKILELWLYQNLHRAVAVHIVPCSQGSKVV